MRLPRDGRDYAVWHTVPLTSAALQASVDEGQTWQDLTAGTFDSLGQFTPAVGGLYHALFVEGPDAPTQTPPETPAVALPVGRTYPRIRRLNNAAVIVDPSEPIDVY